MPSVNTHVNTYLVVFTQVYAPFVSTKVHGVWEFTDYDFKMCVALQQQLKDAVEKQGEGFWEGLVINECERSLASAKNAYRRF